MPRRSNRCSFVGCGRALLARGLCRGHYLQARRHPERPLTPLGSTRRKVGAPLMVRLSPKAIKALKQGARKQGVSLYAYASKALEFWVELPF